MKAIEIIGRLREKYSNKYTKTPSKDKDHYIRWLQDEYAELAMKQANGVNAETKATELYKLLAAGDSVKAEEFRIHLTEPDAIKIVATGVGFDNIRIEPVSANCIIVHACS